MQLNPGNLDQELLCDKVKHIRDKHMSNGIFGSGRIAYRKQKVISYSKTVIISLKIQVQLC